MITVVIVIHLMLAVALIGVIMVQKSEGGALGIGGGSGGMGGFLSGRSAANLLTRTTAILAACFFATSIGLALLASAQRNGGSVINVPASAPASPTAPATPLQTPTGPAKSNGAPATPAPATPAAPSAPLAH